MSICHSSIDAHAPSVFHFREATIRHRAVDHRNCESEGSVGQRLQFRIFCLKFVPAQP
jgi:hypothetical protein